MTNLLIPLLDASFLVAFTVVIVAGLIRGFAGVGSGMLMAPIFILLFGPVDTVVMIVIIEIVTTIQLIPGVYREIEWRVIGPMGIAALLLMPLGSWLLVTIDAETMSRAIAAIVLVFSTILMAGWRYEGSKRAITTIAVGGLSGVMMAATSLGNPPVMIYLLLLPVFLLTAYIGSKLFRKTSEMLYRRVTLGLLICVGIYGLFR
jgi:uncharacterized membrane protein YfcA